MAKVISACHQRRTRSQENIASENIGKQEKKVGKHGSDHIMDLLAQIPPSRELLQHYQTKLAQYEAEEKQLAARVAACAQLLDTSNKLETELVRRETEVDRLRQEMEKISIKLHSERAKVIKLEADNDRLRMKDVENERKVSLLLNLCGKDEERVIKLLEKGEISEGRTGSIRLDKILQKGKMKQANRLRSALSLETEVEQMGQQLVEQEKLHRDQLVKEREASKEAERSNIGDKKILRDKVANYQKMVEGLENQLAVMGEQIAGERSKHRSNENKWTEEKTVLMRKLQFIEKFGTSEGTHTGNRSKGALERRAVGRVKSLEQEASLREKELETVRRELVRVKKDQEIEKAKYEAASDLLSKKTRSMTEQVATLTERCHKQESRKALEAAGYQADIRLLRDRMGQLEDKLVSLSMVNSKDKENEVLLEQLRDELRKIDKNKARKWKQ